MASGRHPAPSPVSHHSARRGRRPAPTVPDGTGPRPPAEPSELHFLRNTPSDGCHTPTQREPRAASASHTLERMYIPPTWCT